MSRSHPPLAWKASRPVLGCYLPDPMVSRGNGFFAPGRVMTSARRRSTIN